MTRRLLFLVAVLAACADEASPPASILYVADRGANRITSFDGVTGDWLGDVAAVDRPSSMRLGPDGLLYIAAFGGSEVLRVDPHVVAEPGRFYMDTEVLEEPVELIFRGPELVVLGHDTHNAVVIDPGGAMVHDVGYPDMRGAHDFVFGTDGLLYVATGHDVPLGTAVQVWDVELGAMIDHFGTLDQLANATGIAAVGDELYITDYERGLLLSFDRAHQPRVLADGFVHPVAVELGIDGMCYVIDDRGIHRLELDGSYLALVVPTGEHLVGPRSATFVPRDTQL